MMRYTYDLVIEIEADDFASVAHAMAEILDRMNANIFVRDAVRKELKRFFSQQNDPKELFN